MTPATATMLELRGVKKSFDGKRALGPIDLHCARGGTTVLIGPSGCGKSTVLRLMIGLLTPDEGQVSFDGEPLAQGARGKLASVRQRMGYVIQDGGLFPHLTSEGNVALLARHIGWEPGRIERRLAELAELTHLPRETLGRFPAELSGGQRQRVGLMRALMLDPDVLLFDEPLAALDPMVRRALQADLRAIVRDSGKTAVLVTHDMGEAAYFADHVVLLRDGAIVQQGSARELVREPAEPFVEEFVNAQRSPLEELA